MQRPIRGKTRVLYENVNFKIWRLLWPPRSLCLAAPGLFRWEGLKSDVACPRCNYKLKVSVTGGIVTNSVVLLQNIIPLQQCIMSWRTFVTRNLEEEWSKFQTTIIMQVTTPLIVQSLRTLATRPVLSDAIYGRNRSWSDRRHPSCFPQ